ncbi:Uncharacterised protein [Brevibacterium casei]|uniref:Uncharacterized protein n=1 Tax=Brevibacterium casei TaxID=33889 RepID=A0A449D7N9_9MICO|nr:hypothetical protein [Brevibacterium casei]VEW13516.1 Uncharacterised protein [Brevibacterium casei]
MALVHKKDAEVELKHLGKDRSVLAVQDGAISVDIRLTPDQVDDLLVEAKDASDKNEAYGLAQQQDQHAERLWRQ